MQPMAPAQVVVGKAEFLGAEQQRNSLGCQRPAEKTASIFEPPQRVLQLAMPNRGGANYERAIGHRFGNARILDRVPDHRAAPRRPIALPGRPPRKRSPRRSRGKPKLLMARAAAPIFSGLRGDTSTTRRLSARNGQLLLQVRVAVQALFVEAQQPPGFFVADAAFAHARFPRRVRNCSSSAVDLNCT